MSLTAADLMSSSVITVRPQTSVRELAEILALRRISGAPVVDDQGRLVGVVSQSDLVAQTKNPRLPNAITLFDWVIYLEGTGRFKAELEKMAGTVVGQIMSHNVISVRPDTPMEDVATIMAEKNVHTIPVVDSGRLIGVIGKLDIVLSLLR